MRFGNSFSTQGGGADYRGYTFQTVAFFCLKQKAAEFVRKSSSDLIILIFSIQKNVRNFRSSFLCFYFWLADWTGILKG